MFSLHKIGEQEDGKSSAQKLGVVFQTMYTHVSICKNDET
jgi:hypothetical protein